jgi:hypothetical protein
MKIKLEDIVKKLDLKVLTKGTSLSSNVSSGYCCDLLSWVMANGKKDAVWITVQTHTNVVAVASLLELAGIIIPSGIPVDGKTIEKAEEEGITVLSSQLGAFELSGLLYQMGIGTDDES